MNREPLVLFQHVAEELLQLQSTKGQWVNANSHLLDTEEGNVHAEEQEDFANGARMGAGVGRKVRSRTGGSWGDPA